MYKQRATFAIVATLALFLYPLSLASQNTFSMSLDANSAAGDQAVTSVSTSADQEVSIQVFGSTIQNATAFGLRFEYDAAQVTYQGFDAGSVLPGTPNVLPPEHAATFVKIALVSLGQSATVDNGLIGTIRFRTTAAFSGTSITLTQGELSRNRTTETVTLTARVDLSSGPSADFDGDGTVGISDFLSFVNHYATSRGDAGYDAKYDLDSNDTIGVSDFLIFVNNFGSGSGSGGGSGGSGGSGGTGDSGGSRADDSDTPSGATSLSLNSRIQAAFETDSDVDYFRVQVRVAGTLVVYTTGSLDTYGELYSGSDSTSVVEANDNYTDGLNFRIWRQVSPGTHYIKVLNTVGDTGSYTFVAGFVPSYNNIYVYPYSQGITYGNQRLYTVAPEYDGAYAYTLSGEHHKVLDFDVSGDAQGITYGNNRFYVVDRSDAKVYAYTSAGQPDPTASFDLDSTDPSGITYGNNRLYVVDNSDGKVYAYTSAGQRDSDADFDLDHNNGNPQGITYANNRFYVVDNAKVYAYTSSGQWDITSDFGLQPPGENYIFSPRGIAYNNNRFYVLSQYYNVSSRYVHTYPIPVE